MPHLDKIGFENFRVFGERTLIDLAPITILTGTNSSGKSSVLKGLQLLQANIDNLSVLNFSKGEHKLGSFDLTLNKNAKSNIIRFLLFEKEIHPGIIIEPIPSVVELSYEKGNNKISSNLTNISIIDTTSNEHIITIDNNNGFHFHHKYLVDNIIIASTYFMIHQYTDYLISFGNFKSYLDVEEYLFETIIDIVPLSRQGKIHLKNTNKESIFLDSTLENLDKIDKVVWRTTNKVLHDNIYMPENKEILIEREKHNKNSGLYHMFYPLFTPDKMLERAIKSELEKFKESSTITDLYSRNNSNNIEELLDIITDKIRYIKTEFFNKINILFKIDIQNPQEYAHFFFNYVYNKESNITNSSKINDIVINKLSINTLQECIYYFEKHFKYYDSILGDSVFDLIIQYQLDQSSSINLADDLFEELNISTFEKRFLKSSEVDFNDIRESSIVLETLKYHKLSLDSIRKENFILINALRISPQRYYRIENEGNSFSSRITTILSSPYKDSILSEVNSLFNKFIDSNKKLSIDLSSDYMSIEIKIDNENLVDLGLGINQIIPLLIELASVQVLTDNDLIKMPYIFYIEEPETNLHPKLQSKFADLFAYIVQKYNNIQFIIETHSEYLIRKLQYLTANKTISSNQTSIYYFYHPEEERPVGEPQIKKIKIQEDGRLSSPFGSGFYDESTRLMNAIFTGETLN